MPARTPRLHLTAPSRPRPAAALLLAAVAAMSACGDGADTPSDRPAPGPARSAPPPQGHDLEIVKGIDAQPLVSHVGRLAEALEVVGAPLQPAARKRLDRVMSFADEAKTVRQLQELFDPLCIASIYINPESRVSVTAGPAPRELVRNGWRAFLVKVHNDAGVTSPLQVTSPEAEPVRDGTRAEVRQRWLDAQTMNARPMPATLSGTELEYRILLLYSRDVGRRGAVLTFDVGQGTQDLGFRSDLQLFFECLPCSTVTLRIRDHDGTPATAALTIRDTMGRLYPSPRKRLAPDFWFQPQVYRADGETVELAPGTYTFAVHRGPEYLVETREVEVGTEPVEAAFSLQRWVNPGARGWWSGDHHIHAAGCKHYDKPTLGVYPNDMVRHCDGEGLNVGCVLTWGRGMKFQKRFFTGEVHEASRPHALLRYDIEVSGFGSDKSGHLCLLRLKEQFYPGCNSWQGWPTLGLEILRWAKKQGAVCGSAHSGAGLWVKPGPLPSLEVPSYDGIGANEFIVDITHEVEGPDGAPVPAVDFMGVCDTPATAELTMWYHVLNCGYRPRISGESDFPCIYGNRVGAGRSYVKLEGDLDFDAWCEGIRTGRCYVSDGASHLFDVKVGGVETGTNGSELRLDAAGPVRVTATVAALLPEQPPENPPRAWLQKPYWTVEKARIGSSRKVTVDVVVNGKVAGREVIVADGTTQDLTIDVDIERSSWVALRILGAAHSNPMFVLVGDKPIRASRRSADWCLKGVDQCWSQKERFIAPREKAAAIAAYDHARAAYRRIAGECEVE